MKALHDAIARYWGYTTFRPLQREAMDAVLAGRDSLVVLPTGGGKSLCFQAPALVRPGLAVVVSPLISLMKDQVDTLVGNGVPAALYNSSLGADEKAAVVAGLREGRYRLLYVSPERLVGDGGDGFLALLASTAASASSPSTKRTASASGATTSGPSTASSARLRQRAARRQPPRVHRHGHRARPARHRDAARPAGSARVRRRRSTGRTCSTACCRGPR